MIVDVRTYTFIPRKMARYLELFEHEALPVMLDHGLELLGYYTVQVGTLNQVIHLWRYEDFADFEAKRAARDADPRWQHFNAITEGLVSHQETRIVRPTSFSPQLRGLSRDAVDGPTDPG